MRTTVFCLLAIATPACSLLLSDDDLTSTEPAGDGGVADDVSSGDEVAAPIDAGSDVQRRTYREEVLADRPVGYWRLGEKDGGTAVSEIDAGPNAKYASTGLSFGVAGLADDSDTAVRFDGTEGCVDGDSSFAFGGRAPFTIEAWVAASLVDAVARRIFSKEVGGGPGGDQGYRLHLSSQAGLVFERVLDNQADRVAYDRGLPSSASHVVGTYDGDAMTLYVGGAEVARTSPATRSIQGIPYSYTIGSRGCSSGGFVGTIDEVAVYDYALPPARIAEHFAAGKRL